MFLPAVMASEDKKTRTVFFRFLLIPVAILTVSAIVIRRFFWNSTDQKTRQVYQKEQASAGTTAPPVTSETVLQPQPKPISPESMTLTKDHVTQYLLSVSENYKDQLKKLTAQDVKNISILLKEFFVIFEQLSNELSSSCMAILNSYFKLSREASHVVAFKIEFTAETIDQCQLREFKFPIVKWVLIEIFKGFIQSFPQVLGTHESREPGCFISLQGIQDGPFDQKHIVSANPAHPVNLSLPGRGKALLSSAGFSITKPSDSAFLPPSLSLFFLPSLGKNASSLVK